MMWSIFSYTYHLYVFFDEVSLENFGSLINQGACFLIVEFKSSFFKIILERERNIELLFHLFMHIHCFLYVPWLEMEAPILA